LDDEQQNCNINPGDWFIKSFEDGSGYFMFGEANAGVATDTLDDSPYWFQYEVDEGQLKVKFVARACEGRQDVFEVDWTRDCNSFTLVPTQGTRTCADGLAGTYEIFSVCITSCRVRPGMALRANDNAFFAVGAGQEGPDELNFPVTVHDPPTGVYWLEFRQTTSRENFEISTVAFLSSRGVLQNEDGAQICVSRGSYDVEFNGPCTELSMRSLGDPCPARETVFDGINLDVSWCSSLGFQRNDEYSGTLITSSAPSSWSLSLFVASLLVTAIVALF